MSDFNYQKYLKNNPLLKKEVKDTLLTEAKDKEVEEVMGVDRKGNKKPDTDGSDASKFKRAAKDVKEMTKKEKEEGDDRKKDDKIEAETEKMKILSHYFRKKKLKLKKGTTTEMVIKMIHQLKKKLKK